MLVLMLCPKQVENTRRGRPWKNKEFSGIDEVVKQLLSAFKVTNDEEEDLFYDFDEVRKEREGTVH